MMKLLILIFVLNISGALITKIDAKPAKPVGEPGADDLSRARKVLKKWGNENSKKAVRQMHVVYWTPADRAPRQQYKQRLSRVLRHIQGFYKKEMVRHDFGERSIQLQQDKGGLVKIHLATGARPANTYTETNQQHGQEIRRDCAAVLSKAGIEADKQTIIIFCNLANWDAKKRTMSHNSPYYAAGRHNRGTAWQLDSPLLDPFHLGVKDKFLQDRQYGRISLGRYNSIFIGGVCHELGHALGLPHCTQCAPAKKAYGTALMGSGNRTYGEELRNESKGSFLTIAHALKLAVHPQFSGSVKQMNKQVRAQFRNWKLVSKAGGLKVNAVVKGNLPIFAIIAYADPAGRGEYNAEIAAAIPQADGSFELTLAHPQNKRSGAVDLHFVAVAVNGSATASVWSQHAFTFKAKMSADGKLDVSEVLQGLQKKK
ncbi:MAG: hypothetical protein HRT88_21895 [Lentisphaeraceae bacterium]|nr:hypothetical protein [Lentisphaeraceae bacterium]